MNIRKIESRDNPRLKLARKVRDGIERDLIFIEGTRLVEEAVKSDLVIEFCVFEKKYAGEIRHVDLLESVWTKTSEILEVNERLCSSISDTRSSQGIVLICRRPEAHQMAFEQALAKRSGSLQLVIMLNEVNNPSNLGAVIRTCEAAGVVGVIISNNSADAFSPKALRGAMGSTFRVPIWAGANHSDVLAWAGSMNFSTVGASANADRSYTEVDWAAPHLLLMGSEAHGIPRYLEANLHELVRIPMDTNVDSLNLAVAAGIILFEAKRQMSAARKS